MAVSLPTTQADHPLAEHGCIDQGVAPERIANARTAPGQVANGLVRDEHHLACGQRAEAVVHHVEMETLKVGHVARNVERENLSLAVLGQLVSEAQAWSEVAQIVVRPCWRAARIVMASAGDAPLVEGKTLPEYASRQPT